MPRELLILRHGQAGQAGRDRDRQLTDLGRADVDRVGRWIKERGQEPSRAISSPAVRAHATAKRCLEAAGLPLSTLAIDERIYDADTGDLLDLLAGSVSVERLLLVGHNPALSDLASYLSGQRVSLSPATLVVLQMPADWVDLGAGSGQLLERV